MADHQVSLSVREVTRNTGQRWEADGLASMSLEGGAEQKMTYRLSAWL